MGSLYDKGVPWDRLARRVWEVMKQGFLMVRGGPQIRLALRVSSSDTKAHSLALGFVVMGSLVGKGDRQLGFARILGGSQG